MKNKFIILLLLLLIPMLGLTGRHFIITGQQSKEADYHKSFAKTIELYSKDFSDNGKIPEECSGKGGNTAPSLYWSNLPEGTRSVVILMTDYDSPARFLKLSTVSHWIVYDIPPSYKEIKKGITSVQLQQNGIKLGQNYTEGTGYAGPKPPIGVHRYYFRVYALSAPSLNLTKPEREEIMEAMKGYVLAYGELVGKF